MTRMGARGVSRLTALAVWLMASAVSLGSWAQSAQAQTYVPSARIGTADFITPTAANTFYGSSTTATVGVAGTSIEVQELGRALRNDPDLIYDYVRNNIEIEWTYGSQKGSLGTVLDRSGSAFDQVRLMVDLLRQAGFTTTYRAGTITLTGAQFQAWSGITRATAACQLLSSGGIPGVINGATTANCNYGSAAVSSITLSHIWASVVIDGTAYAFDPSYKPHAFTSGVNLQAAAGLTSGQALASTATGMESGTASGVSYVRNLSAEGLNPVLQGYGQNLLDHIDANLPTGDIRDLVGGATIERFETPTGGLRQTALPYPSTVLRSWTGGIPNQYRTTLRVQIRKVNFPSSALVQIMDRTLYVDEIYGRKLVVQPNYPAEFTAYGYGPFEVALRLTDRANAGPTLASYSLANDYFPERSGEVTLTANHPYAATAPGGAAGSYMDRAVIKRISMHLPLTLVNAWGAAGRGLQASWDSRPESLLPLVPYPPDCEYCTNSYSQAGDARREQLAVSWMVQGVQAAQLHAQIAGGVFTHHHSLGVVNADATPYGVSLVPEVPPPTSSIYYAMPDNFDRLDVDTGFSLTHRLADATARRAAVHAIASTMEAMEGSVAAQVADLPDTTSTSTRFEWGNRPPAGEDPSGGYGPRRFYRYNAANAGQALGLSVVEGMTSTTNDGIAPNIEPEISNYEVQQRRSALADAVQTFTSAGFDVIASAEAFLGPGQRGGSFRPTTPDGYLGFHMPTQQRSGAIVATRYSGADPVEIAHIAVGHDEMSKGGGGGAQTDHQARYDPSQAADILKARYVDRSQAMGVSLLTGGVTYVAPAQLTVGAGEFPYSLTGNVFWRGGAALGPVLGAQSQTQPQTPWSSNWNNSLSISASGREALGETDPRAAAGTVAAFLAQQDIYRAAPSLQRDVAATLVGGWWMRQVAGNVATVNVGADTRQFLRNVRGQWFTPGAAGYATLVQTGQRTPFVERCPANAYGFVTTRGWNYTGMTFQVVGANGDRQNFVHHTQGIASGTGCFNIRGFRLTSWTFPQGVTINLTYSSPDIWTAERLVAVSNTLGRRLELTYSSGISGFNNGLTGAGPRAVGITRAPSGDITQVTDAAGAVTRFTTVRAGGGNGVHRLMQVFRPGDTTVPSLEYTYDGLNRVMEARDAVSLQVGGRGPYQFRLAGVRGEREDPAGGRYTALFDENDRLFRAVDELGRTTRIQHDGRGRPITYTYPEGDQQLLAYDARNNVTRMTRRAKPGSPLADTVAQVTWHATWNRPTRVIDARGGVTDLTYVASGLGAGQVATVRRPAPTTGAARPLYSYTYGAFGQVLNETDPTSVVVSHAYNATTGLRTSTTLDPSGINAVTSFLHDAQGDVTRQTNPRGGVIQQAYDAARRPTMTRRHNGAVTSAVVAAERSVYDARGRVIRQEVGTAFSSSNVTAWATQQARTYTPTDQVATVTNGAGNVTTNAYDALDRLQQVTDPVGRVTRLTYDLAGQLTREQRAFGTALQQNYARYTYTPNGQRATVRDAAVNRTTYVYDGFDRLSRTRFPVPAVGANQSSATDYEEYAYDASDNVVQVRHRDGVLINRTYDALNREILTDLPVGTANDVHSTWDAAGRRLSARYGSVTGQGVIYAYDTAGRLASEASFGRTMSYQYDLTSNRTRVTWPDGQYVQYVYDPLNRMTQVRENGAASGAGLLAVYGYDARSRPVSITRGGGAGTTLAWDGASRLTSLAHNLVGSANDVTYGFTWTAASQMSQRTVSNAGYDWTTPNGTTAYVRNGLNQYTQVGGVTVTHNARGSMTSDGVRGFGYDALNRLASTTGTGATALTYDPLGRLRATTTGGVQTQYLYDGDRLVAEYSAAGALTARYVHGLGVDDPIVWYSGAGMTDRRWLIADHQGSVVASTTAAGVTTRHAYGPYGEPLDWSGPRFRFTGQIALPGPRLYHYKARAYDPTLGRFLQTDPVGYDDQMNLYAYVNNDPVNNTDPTGMFQETVFTRQQDIRIRNGEAEQVAQKGADAAQVLIDNPRESADALGTGISLIPHPVTRSAGTVIRGGARLIPGRETSVPVTAPASTLRPGPFSDRSIPARGTERNWTAGERAANNANMAEGGCHTCGTRDPGTRSGNAVPDHQPPSALNPPGGQQRLYPQCIGCSTRQMREVRQEQLRIRREGQ